MLLGLLGLLGCAATACFPELAMQQPDIQPAAGSHMIARRGSGLLRIEHRIGSNYFSVDLPEPLEIRVYEARASLRRRKDLHVEDWSCESIDAALDQLWESHLMFNCGDQCLALATWRQGGEPS